MARTELDFKQWYNLEKLIWIVMKYYLFNNEIKKYCVIPEVNTSFFWTVDKVSIPFLPYRSNKNNVINPRARINYGQVKNLIIQTQHLCPVCNKLTKFFIIFIRFIYVSFRITGLQSMRFFLRNEGSKASVCNFSCYYFIN